ncbi:MAG: MarR family transcriptional regulator [Thermoflexaceae bacterium]|nr:MarR family transcriptional regulator [Thermoflexaceae bacterium]
MTDSAVVHVLTRDPALRRALLAHLEADESLPVAAGSDPAEVKPGDVVVAPSSDCLPERCAEFAARGARVIVLATLPAEAERQRYLAAGVFAYLPMAIGSRPLPVDVRSAMAAPLPDPAAAHHDWLLLTKHGLVLLFLGSHPAVTVTEIATAIGISPDRTRRILNDLAAKGFITAKKAGRSTSYTINPDARFIHPAMAHVSVRGVIDATRPPAAGP